MKLSIALSLTTLFNLHAACAEEWTVDLAPGESTVLEYTNNGDFLATTTCTATAPEGYMGDVDIKDTRYDANPDLVTCKGTTIDSSNETCSLLSLPGETTELLVEHFFTSFANDTEDVVVECTSKEVQLVEMGVPISLSMVRNEQVFYKLPQVEDEGQSVHCNVAPLEGYPNATVEIKMFDYEQLQNASFCTTYIELVDPGRGMPKFCSLTPTSENNNLVVGVTSRPASTNNFEAVLTCYVTSEDAPTMEVNELPVTAPIVLEAGEYQTFVYTNPEVMEQVDCQLIAPTDNMTLILATTDRYLDGRQAYCQANEESCTMAVLKDDVNITMSVFAEHDVEDAMLQCISAEVSSTTLQSTEAQNVTLAPGEAAFFEYNHTDELLSDVYCTFQVVSNGTNGQGLLFSGVPMGVSGYSIPRSVAVLERDWYATSQEAPRTILVLLENTFDLPQEVEVQCTSDPYVPLTLGEELEFETVSGMYDLFQPNTEDIGFPFNLSCTVSHDGLDDGRVALVSETVTEGIHKQDVVVRGERRTNSTMLSAMMDGKDGITAVGITVWPSGDISEVPFAITCTAKTLAEELESSEPFPMEESEDIGEMVEKTSENMNAKDVLQNSGSTCNFISSAMFGTLILGLPCLSEFAL